MECQRVAVDSRAWITAAYCHLEEIKLIAKMGLEKISAVFGHLVPQTEGVKNCNSLAKSDADDPLVDADVRHLAAELDVVHLEGRMGVRGED